MKRIVLYAGILFLLLLNIVVVVPATAETDAVTWARVNIPTEGKAGGWVLAKGSGIQCLAKAGSGTLYSYATPAGTTNTLFKSIDGGKTWSYIPGVTSVIVDIAALPDDSNVLFYATASSVFVSEDAGQSFGQLPPNPGGAGSSNISITAIDVTGTAGNYTVITATKDTDAGEFGGVYIYTESAASDGWRNMSIGDYDVYDVAISPQSVNGERHPTAVANNEIDTHIRTSVGFGSWSDYISDTVIPLNPLVSADIAFPDDYGASGTGFDLFVGFSSGSDTGDVYKISGRAAPEVSSYTDFNIGRNYSMNDIDVNSIEAIGSELTAKIFAGATGSAQVYSSNDGGQNWSKSAKPPTGAGKTSIVTSPDFAESGEIFAATSGADSALSISLDNGDTWDQLSLINTQIASLVDFAPSPNYSNDNTVFLLTFGEGKHSLWRSQDGGTCWRRIFSSALPDVTALDCIRLSPQYSTSQVVYVTGNNSGSQAVWKSGNGGKTFQCPHPSIDPISATPFNIDQMLAVDDNTLIVGTFNGSNGVIYTSADGGLSYSRRGITGTSTINSIAVSAGYTADKSILVGDNAGWVYLSTDKGVSFDPLPLDAASAPLSGGVTVAFDDGYALNHTVFAASDTAGKGLYRFTVGQSTKWENIDSTMPAASILNKFSITTSGILYAANAKAGSGVERSLDATSAAPAFDTLTANLDATAKLYGLWVSGNRLWSLDTVNSKLLTLADSLSTPVVPSSPADKSAGINTKNVSLSWEPLPGATVYEWQVDTDSQFTTVLTGFDDTTESTSARLPALDPSTTYYWRVRVVAPAGSPWSAGWSFTTELSGDVTAPRLTSPDLGDKVSLRPIFQWSQVNGAQTYELIVATDPAFADAIVDKTGDNALPSNAWQCDITLNPGTTYYWKVRAKSPVSYSAWSGVSVFITEASITTTTTTTNAIAAPRLTSPDLGDKVSLRPVFQWSQISSADNYELIIATDPAFVYQVVTKTGANALPANAWRCDVTLNPETTYYWEVRAKNVSSYSAWSSVSIFVTEALTTTTTTTKTTTINDIAAPRLTSPDLGDTVSLSPVLQWSQVSGAEAYELIIATDPAFIYQVVTKTGANTLPTNIWRCDITLNPDITYYWMVRAKSPSGYSAWSGVRLFITEAPVSTAIAASPTTVTILVTVTTTLTEPPETSVTQPDAGAYQTIMTTAPDATVMTQPTSTLLIYTTSSPNSPTYSDASPSSLLTTTQVIQVQQNTPGWVTWVVYTGGGLLAVMIVVLIVLVVLVSRIGRYE